MNNIKLIPADDKQMFITDIQKAFKESYEAVYGTYEGEIISIGDIEESFSKANAQCYFALINDEIAGGVVVLIDKNTQKNNLDLLYVKSDYQSKGVGLKIWQEIENTYPETMLMYGKEASNRKQEIDRQHYTIPNQRPKDKHCGKI